MEKYYIWLLLALGEAEPEISRLMKQFGTAEKVYEAFGSNIALAGAELNEKAAKTGLAKAEKLLAGITSSGIRIITWESPEYPAHLKNVENPPCALFAQGDVSLLQKKLVTVVGSRSVTRYTESVIPGIIERIGKDYAVVSSLSEGCDQLVCLNAIKAGVPFIEVLPCGFSHTYPTGSRSLRKFLLANNGLIITEFLPKTSSGQGNFLRRSRIIGGISYVTLVLQAGLKSGALATAEYSYAPIFVPPYDIFRNEYAGAVNAVRNGAKLYLNASSIDKAYDRAVDTEKERHNEPMHKSKFRKSAAEKEARPDKQPAEAKEKALPENKTGKADKTPELETPEQTELYRLISEAGGTVTLEALIAKTGKSADQLAETLLDLEINGAVVSAGNRYTVS